MKFHYCFPPMEEFDLANGLRIICLPDSEQHGMVIALQLPFGRFSDTAGKEGLCELAVNLLAKGTESFSSEEIAEKLEHAGAILFTDIGEEHCTFGIRMRAATLNELMPLFIEMITRPRFDRDEFKRIRQEMVTGLLAETADTSFISMRHFYAELTAGTHPAGLFQTVRSLRSIRLEDVRRFFADYFSPHNSVAVIAGDWEKQTLVKFATEQFSLWKRNASKKGVIAAPLQPLKTKSIRLVHKPGLTQTTLAMGHPAPGERCLQKNALLLANHIFGGGNFSSRLMTRIRTSGGKSYGIASQLLSETDFGAFMITTSTQNRQLTEVMSGIMEEYRRFCSEGVTAEELEKAKRFAIGSMAFQLEGIGQLVDKLLWLRFYGKPNSYIEHFDELISSIDREQVNSAINTHFFSEHFVIVAVGKKEEVEVQLKPIGPVKSFHFRHNL